MESADPSSPLLALTTGLARGDNQAWEQFHREYGPGIFRHLLALAQGDGDFADEALQQTYLRLARHARACDCAPMFSSWLRLITRSAASDIRRGRRNFWQMLRRYHEAVSEPETSREDEERLQEALDAALLNLAAEDRALLEAKYFAGQSIRDIAQSLSLSPKAVESRLTRARAALRSELRSFLPYHEK